MKFLYWLYVIVIGLIVGTLGWHEFSSPLKIHPADLVFRYEGSAEDPPSPFFIYRRQPERQGWQDLQWPLHGRLSASTKIENFNLGIHDASKATPTFDEDAFYVGSDSGWFRAFTHAGQLIWEFRVYGAGFGIHSSAAVDSQNVYFGAYNGRFYALNKKTGQPVWVKEVGSSVGSSPVLLGPLLFVSVETTDKVHGHVLALHRSNGETVWRSPDLGDHPHSSPALATAEGLVIVGANNGLLHALDIHTGELKWTANFPGAIKSTPMVLDQVVYATSWRGGFKSLELKTGKVVTSFEMPSDSQVSPTWVPDLNLILAGDHMGNLFAFDHKTGKKVWSKKWADTYQLSSPLVMSFGREANKVWRAWIACGEAKLCLIDAQTGNIVSETQLDGDLSGTPAATEDGHLWLALDAPGSLQAFTW